MTPEISIIMPMYNVEKYVGECLDSLLAQTFQDFEVIIVDDCSTDNSCAVVESYMKIFNSKVQEKLRLIRSEKNSGCCAVPRNIGMPFARGKYIYFVDSDDALTETALEELYNLAEDFQTEVVHCEKYFIVQDEDFTTDKDFLTADAFLKADFVEEPAFMTKNISERMENFVSKKFDWSTCTNFIRRDFLLKHDIKFPPITGLEDRLVAIQLLGLSKKFLRVPNAVYIYRQRTGSLSKLRFPTFEPLVKTYSKAFFYELTLTDKFFTENKIFEDEPLKKWSVFNFFVDYYRRIISNAWINLPINELYKFVRHEVEKFDDKTTLAAFLFTYMNLLRLQLNESQEKLNLCEKIFQSQNNENERLTEIIKKQRRYMNYQRVQVQNLKSVFSSQMPLP